MTTKSQLRREVARKRKELDVEWVAASSRLVVQRLEKTSAFQAATTVALYQAIAGEVDLSGLFARCWAGGKRTCIPVFNAGLNSYEMAEITPETSLKRGNHRIQEPESPVLFPLENIDLMVVPGVAFDPKGNRLGRGGGYYDRLLDGFAGQPIAVAFDFQIYPEIPADHHDQPVGCIVTETKTVKVQNEH